MTAKNIKQLVKENAEKYYTNGTQNLSDEAFDALVDELKKENPESEVLVTGWGYEPEDSMKVKHKYVNIGSLSKAKNLDEVNKLISNDNESNRYYDITPKLDGLSVVLYYKEGLLERALTRGNGEYGIDITSKVNQINYRLATLSANSDDEIVKNFTGAVRGEIIMTNNNFKLFKEKYPEAKNPRNSAAGIINKTRNIDVSDFSYLDIFIYTVVAIESNFNKDINIENLRKFMHNAFGEFALKSDYFNLLDSKNYYEIFSDLKEQYSEVYPVDGIVLTNTDDLNIGNNIIEYEQCAFKFQDEVKVGVVDHIEWTASKNNNYIPVIVLKDALVLEGTNVQRVSGYNAKFILDNQIKKDSIVYVKKANQIIPQIIEVTNFDNNEFELPTKCSFCGHNLVWDENNVNLCCINENCENKNIEDFKIWCLNIAPVDDLGWKTIKKLVSNQVSLNDIKIDDIYNNKLNKFNINEDKGEKYLFNKMLDKLLNDEIKPSQFLLALNIPGLGKKTAEKFDTKDFKMYFDYIANELPENLGIESMFIELKNLIQDFPLMNRLRNEYNNKFVKMYNMMKNRISFDNESAEEVVNKGDIVITGKLSVKRDMYIKKVESKGWTVKSKVTKDTKYLITNDKDSNTSKAKDADKFNVPKLTEKEFEEIM